MITNHAIPHPATASGRFTLNDLRLRSYAAQEKSSNSALGVSGLVLVAVVAIGALVILNPFALFAPPEPKAAAPQSAAFVPSAEPARPAAVKEIIVAQPSVPAMKAIEEPAVTTPAVQAPRASAPAVRHSSSSITLKSRSNPAAKTDTTVLQVSPKEKVALPELLTEPAEKAAPPVLLTKPEEKTDAPIVLKRGDDIKDAPRTAATNALPPVTEEAN
jgi:hypothetical protein